MRSRLPLAAAFALGVAATTALPARADFLIDPTGGTLLFNNTTASGEFDDTNIARTVPFQFAFFGGTGFTTFSVHTNGYLTFGSTPNLSTFSNTALPSTEGRFSVLWDDLFLSANGNGFIRETIGPGNAYYAITWDVDARSVRANTSPSTRQQFQFVVFDTNVTLGGFTFQADDFVYVYSALGAGFEGATFPTQHATIGLSNGNAAQTVLAPNAPATTGLYTTAQRNLIPRFTQAGNYQVLLFRRNAATSNYTSQILSLAFGASATAPEPGTVALALPLVGAGVAALARRRARRG
jgi:hypothetical protein